MRVKLIDVYTEPAECACELDHDTLELKDLKTQKVFWVDTWYYCWEDRFDIFIDDYNDFADFLEYNDVPECTDFDNGTESYSWLRQVVDYYEELRYADD